MGVVTRGAGEIEIEGFDKFDIEMYGTYYIMPEKLLKIRNMNSEPLIIYLANSDI